MKNFISNTKSLRFTGLKVSPSTPSDDQLTKINQFTRRPFVADELYIGQLWLANNAIDRDNERYNEEILQHFNRTIIRKTFLLDHGKYDIQKKAVGKFFDSIIETVSLDEAKRITGEDIELPAGVTDVLFLSPWFYIPKAGVDEEILVKIDAGIFDFVSLGYRAERLVPITDQKGTVLYYEYQGRGEATEGSLVYLGAQHGAGVKSATEKEKPAKEKEKKPGENPGDNKEQTNEGGKEKMKELAKRLMKTFGKVFSEDDEGKLYDEIKALIDEKNTKITALTTDVAAKETKIVELTPLAADGKAFREDLITQYVTSKAKLGEVAETPEAQKVVKDVAATYPIEFLKGETAALQKRVAEKFPDEGKLTGDDRKDKSNDGGEKGWKEENPLVPKE